MRSNAMTILSTPVYRMYTKQNASQCLTLKKILSSAICYAERNLNEISYKKNGIGSSFKEKFPFISGILNDDDLRKFMRLYARIRVINVHYTLEFSQNRLRSELVFNFSKVSSQSNFLGLDMAWTDASGNLTVYGMLSVISLLLNSDQFWAYIGLLCQNHSFFALNRTYLSYDSKKALRDRFNENIIALQAEKDSPLIFCEEQFIVPLVATTFLELEKEILYKCRIPFSAQEDLSFKDIAQHLPLNSDNRNKLICLRNMWAHGNCFYYVTDSDNLIISFIRIMKALLTTDYSMTATRGLNALKRTVLQVKYKRPVEMALKLQNDKSDAEALVHRLQTMTTFKDFEKDLLIPIALEDKIVSEIDCDVCFRFQNKEESIDDYIFSSIEIIEHHAPNDKVLNVEGVDTGLTYFKEYALPEYPQLRVNIANQLNVQTSFTAGGECKRYSVRKYA